MNRLLLLILILSSPSLADAKDRKWKEHRAQHFIIYYDQVPLDIVKTVEKAAEEEYSQITDNLGFTRSQSWSFDDRAKIYIYDDADDYVTAGKQARWSHGAASVRQKEIRTFPSMHGFFDSTLPHELGHIIFREFIGFSANVPLWFEEGVAMYQEKAKRWGVNAVVKEAIEDGSFMPLNELSATWLYADTDKKIVELFYAESASAVYYMISELGEYRFLNLCRKLKGGDSFEEALKSAYGRFRNLDELNRAWLEYLKH